MSVKKYTYVRKTRTIDGKRYEVYGKTEKEAQQKLDALIVELANNGQKLDGSTTSGAGQANGWKSTSIPATPPQNPCACIGRSWILIFCPPLAI